MGDNPFKVVDHLPIQTHKPYNNLHLYNKGLTKNWCRYGDLSFSMKLKYDVEKIQTTDRISRRNWDFSTRIQ